MACQLISFKKIASVLFVPIALLLPSCGGGHDAAFVGGADSSATTVAAPAAAPVYDAKLPKGKVTDSVLCKDASQTFAFYLPTTYSVDKASPCIYFFDPHGHGVLPVNMYKDLAEQYGFVLIGSNASKNGIKWEDANKDIKALMNDVWSRIHIDERRIYTAGFSGGARVASSVALQNGGVAGVISCGAGFPRGMPPHSKFDHFGLVGNQDFNLAEMNQLEVVLEQNNFMHQLLVFDGKHAWPPAATFRTALLWMQVNGMREQLQPKNDTLVPALKSNYDQLIATASATGDPVKQTVLLSGAIKALNGLTDVTGYNKQLTTINNSDAYKKAFALQQQLHETESKQQLEIAQEYTKHDETYWTGTIDKLRKDLHNNKAKQAQQMDQRLLNFLGLISYLNANHAIEGGDLEHAATYLNIFKKADPQNADQPYLTAEYYVKKQDIVHAIASLKEAAGMGYSDVGQLMGDVVFGGLHEDAGFKEVVGMVGRNAGK